MSYHIYSTEGIILKRTPTGEANIFVHVLTRDLGLIIATAQSARLSTSKLSSALTEYSLVTISCIKGKRGWKITDARTLTHFYFSEETAHLTRTTFAQISFFLLKMIPGEEAHIEIFDIVRSGFEYLNITALSDPKDFESVIVLRILYMLGYVIKNADTEMFLKEIITWNSDTLEEAKIRRQMLIYIINTGLNESHL